MATKKRRKQDSIAKALGASRVIQMEGRRSGGPLDWLMLVQAVQSRLISRGGRPSDPQWDTKRLVPFRRQIWKSLARHAETISAEGRHVGPAQLAAIVIEQTLASTKSNILQGQTWFIPSLGNDQMWRFSNAGLGVETGNDPRAGILPEVKAQPYSSEQSIGAGS